MSGYEKHVREEADDLDAFEFETGDRLARFHNHPELNEPDQWAVVERRFKYTVRYLPDRDGIPHPSEHRIYDLANEEFEETTVTEFDLLNEWVRVEQSDTAGVSD